MFLVFRRWISHNPPRCPPGPESIYQNPSAHPRLKTPPCNRHRSRMGLASVCSRCAPLPSHSANLARVSRPRYLPSRRLPPINSANNKIRTHELPSALPGYRYSTLLGSFDLPRPIVSHPPRPANPDRTANHSIPNPTRLARRRARPHPRRKLHSPHAPARNYPRGD